MWMGRKADRAKSGQLCNDSHLNPVNLVLHLPTSVCRSVLDPGEINMFDINQGLVFQNYLKGILVRFN